MKLNLGLLSAVVSSCAAAGYPATFPFENESFVPVAVPAGTPDWSYDPQTDSGAYIYHYYARPSFDLTDADWESPTLFGEDTNAAWSPTQTGAIRYLLVNQFGAPFDIPASVWNCTAKEFFFSDADFTGVLGGNTVCTVGECCANLMGLIKYSDNQLTWHDWMNDRSASAMCGDITEETYCVLVGGDYQTNCFEYYLSPSDRLITFICPDSYCQYYLSCPVYLQLYVPVYAEFEPPSYYTSITMEEMISSDAGYFSGDRVCNPYSYYHPESAGGGGGGGGDSASSSSSASAASEDSSSPAALVFGTLLTFVAAFSL